LTPEQSALIDKAKKSVAAANLLNEQGYPGFAASRAYYAMLYAAQALLLSKALSFSKHSAVIAAFGREFAKSGLVPTELHRFLIEASDSRKVSDYDIAGDIGQDVAGMHIDRARQFLEAITQLLD
jgi:uncharacterized protein (UPF0332 family)